MRYLASIFLLFPIFLFAQKNVIPKVEPTAFLRDILGAKYAKSDKSWTLPRTQAMLDTFEADATGGLFVGVDTILFRTVGDTKEAWVLFTVEGYMFNFARLEKTEGGWKKKAIYYRFHEGKHGNYGPEGIGFHMIAQKTFISVREYWFKKGVTTRKWQLFDPFTRENVGSIELEKKDEKDRSPDVYLEFKTTKTAFEATDQLLPDIVLTQQVERKEKGKKAVKETRTVRYGWSNRKNRYDLLEE
jgi:hypothetical protein